MKVVILGAGPSGLMAAHAAMERGHSVELLDRDGVGALERLHSGEVNAGVMLLHDHCNIASLMGHSKQVRYAVYGQDVQFERELARQYREKVYPDHPGVDVSLSKYYGAVRKEWDGVAAAQTLAHIMKPFVHVWPEGGVLSSDSVQHADRLISTVPLKAAVSMGLLGDSYSSDMVDAETGAGESSWPSVLVYVDNANAPSDEQYVWYFPHPDIPYYRVSGVFGRFTAEYSVGEVLRRPDDLRPVIKPIAPIPAVVLGMAQTEKGGETLFAGRMGRWNKDVQMHDVYEAVAGWLGD